MKILMFSGGIDSTYLAWKLMLDKTKNLHLHHVSIRNDSDKMWKQQDKAVKPILEYFKDQGFEFEYSESVFEFFGWIRVGFDSDILLLIAQKLAQNFGRSKIEVLLGWVPSDMRRSVIAERARRHVTSNIWEALIESATNRKVIDKTLHFPLIEENITKIKMIRDMPQELLDLTWSCRKPRNGNPCGHCHACRDKSNALIKITGEKNNGRST